MKRSTRNQVLTIAAIAAIGYLVSKRQPTPLESDLGFSFSSVFKKAKTVVKKSATAVVKGYQDTRTVVDSRPRNITLGVLRTLVKKPKDLFHGNIRQKELYGEQTFKRYKPYGMIVGAAAATVLTAGAGAGTLAVAAAEIGAGSYAQIAKEKAARDAEAGIAKINAKAAADQATADQTELDSYINAAVQPAQKPSWFGSIVADLNGLFT